MADIVDSAKRSEMMSAVGRRDTGPEMRLRRALWGEGLRYRVHQSIVGTRPDIVFRGPEVAVFVDGCFWHGCPEHYSEPGTNASFWKEKIEKNRARDRRDEQDLSEAGWTVLRFWECDINERLQETVDKVQQAVDG